MQSQIGKSWEVANETMVACTIEQVPNEGECQQSNNTSGGELGSRGHGYMLESLADDFSDTVRRTAIYKIEGRAFRGAFLGIDDKDGIKIHVCGRRGKLRLSCFPTPVLVGGVRLRGKRLHSRPDWPARNGAFRYGRWHLAGSDCLAPTPVRSRPFSRSPFPVARGHT